MAIANLANPLQKAFLWYNIAPFSLDRFDDNRGNLLWRQDCREEFFFEIVETGMGSVGNVGDAGKQRSESLTLDSFRAG